MKKNKERKRRRELSFARKIHLRPFPHDKTKTKEWTGEKRIPAFDNLDQSRAV